MSGKPWKINYPCGCQFDGQDFPEPPEYCPAHGRPATLLGFPIVYIEGCPSCAAKDKRLAASEVRVKEAEGKLCAVQQECDRCLHGDEPVTYAVRRIAEALSSTGPCPHEAKVARLEKVVEAAIPKVCPVTCGPAAIDTNKHYDICADLRAVLAGRERG